MITEAIWTQRKHIKGSSRAAIRQFILDKYDVDESRIKSNLASNLNKMLEDTEEGYPCIIRVDNMNNYKLTPEWRKEWTTTYGKKHEIKRRRRKRPSDHPKHPRNAYLYFTQEVRPRRKEQYPDKSFGELTILIANEWKSLSTVKRKRFDELAKKDKKRYEREKNEYEANRETTSSSDSESESRDKRKRRKSRSNESEDSRSHLRKKKKREKSVSESESGSEEKKDRKKARATKNESSDQEKDKAAARSELKSSSDKTATKNK
jgi:structure-specific recognition protein 1